MGRPKGSSNNARQRLIEAAGRGFRQGGFGGVGVDALAKEAGLTSGAFYSHFGSKAEAFRCAVSNGLEVMKRGIEAFQAAHGANWHDAFIDFYFGERMNAELAEACPLVMFTVDAARAEQDTQQVYAEALAQIAAALSKDLPAADAAERVQVLMALLVGGASIGRAMPAGPAREQMLAEVRAAAKRVVGQRGVPAN